MWKKILSPILILISLSTIATASQLVTAGKTYYSLPFQIDCGGCIGYGSPPYIAMWLTNDTFTNSIMYQNGSNIEINGSPLCTPDNGYCAFNATGYINGTGTPTYLAMWNGANEITDSVIFQNGTYIGIGTTAPTSKLDVIGNVNVSQTLYASNVSSNSPLQLQTQGITRIYINDTNGNVGIGTDNPIGKLHINMTNNGTPGLVITANPAYDSEIFEVLWDDGTFSGFSIDENVYLNLQTMFMIVNDSNIRFFNPSYSEYIAQINSNNGGIEYYDPTNTSYATSIYPDAGAGLGYDSGTFTPGYGQPLAISRFSRYNWYNQYGANYERVAMGFNNNIYEFSSEANGSGTIRDFAFLGGNVNITQNLYVNGSQVCTPDNGLCNATTSSGINTIQGDAYILVANGTITNLTFNSSNLPVYNNLSLSDMVAGVGNFSAENASLARIGNCPAGEVVMNTTTSGVQCVPLSVATGIQTIQSLSPSYLNVDNGTTSNLTINLTGFDNRYLQGLGILGYISLWNSTTTLNSSLIFQNGTYIGIGTTAPTSKLDVIGNATIGNSTGTAQFDNDGSLTFTGTAQKWKREVLVVTQAGYATGFADIIFGETYAAAGRVILGGRTYFMAYPNAVVGGNVGAASSWQWVVPYDRVNASIIKVRVHWMPADATTGNVLWRLGERHATLGQSYAQIETIQNLTTAVPGEALQRGIYEFNVTSIGNGDHIDFTIARDGEDATDTYANDVYVSDIEVWYLSDRIGVDE